MKIPVEVTASEWDELLYLASEKENEFINEEEYVDGVMKVIGKRLRTRPVEGDELILKIRTTIFSMNPDIPFDN